MLATTKGTKRGEKEKAASFKISRAWRQGLMELEKERVKSKGREKKPKRADTAHAVCGAMLMAAVGHRGDASVLASHCGRQV